MEYTFLLGVVVLMLGAIGFLGCWAYVLYLMAKDKEWSYFIFLGSMTLMFLGGFVVLYTAKSMS